MRASGPTAGVLHSTYSLASTGAGRGTLPFCFAGTLVTRALFRLRYCCLAVQSARRCLCDVSSVRLWLASARLYMPTTYPL